MNNRDSIIQQYLDLADDATFENNIKDGDDSKVLDQITFMTRNHITRLEIDQYKKRNTKRFDNVADAMKSFFS
jgi:hypothetical protein